MRARSWRVVPGARVAHRDSAVVAAVVVAFGVAAGVVVSGCRQEAAEFDHHKEWRRRRRSALRRKCRLQQQLAR